ncbi:MAG TPA: type II secretion system protein [Bacteroidia bacterium]|nr:type II secretion system protein [Bacteroidia bacterium]
MSIRKQGFTVVELLVTIGIVVLLAALLVPISDTLRKRAEKAKCISHMRAIHSSLSAHLLDKGSWPQMPDGERWDENKFYQFWITSLEPYGSSQATWLCPSDKLLLQMKQSDMKDQYFGTYVPTAFDKNPSSPVRWNQPWLIERGNFHGKGGHMLMPDGSVQDSMNPFYGR